MAYQALATPETGANPTGTASVSANGTDKASIANRTSQKIKKTGEGAASAETYSGEPVWLLPANRKTATNTFFAPPFWMIPERAEIVSVGKHSFREIYCIAWASHLGDVIVAILAPVAEAGRSILVRTWTAGDKSSSRSREWVLTACDDQYSAAFVVTQPYDGTAVAGIALLLPILDGEEQR